MALFAFTHNGGLMKCASFVTEGRIAVEDDVTDFR